MNRALASEGCSLVQVSIPLLSFGIGFESPIIPHCFIFVSPLSTTFLFDAECNGVSRMKLTPWAKNNAGTPSNATRPNPSREVPRR
jgi:hypothetical protein